MRPKLTLLVIGLTLLVLLLSMLKETTRWFRESEAERRSCRAWVAEHGRPFRAGHLLECCVVGPDGAVRCRP